MILSKVWARFCALGILTFMGCAPTDGTTASGEPADLVRGPPDLRRTVVFMYGPTQTGQDLFLRGGIDHGQAERLLGRQCTAQNMECAIPVAHRNLRNATTSPWKNNDAHLDWYGTEPGQMNASLGSPADWTTDHWPSDWGSIRTVEVDGYGVEPLNRWGGHYWMLDVDMDCSRAFRDENGVAWFELKTFISNGPGWEADIRQPGAPYPSNNHFGQCGMINVFRRSEDAASFVAFPEAPEVTDRCEPQPMPPAGQGRTLYVATSGNDTQGTGSATSPWATLERAARSATAGDTVVVRGGTYPIRAAQWIGSQGSADRWITFRPAAGESVVLDASGTPLSAFGDKYRGMVTLGGSYLVFEGFELRNSVASGLKFFQAHHLVVRNCRIHAIAEQALGGSADDVLLQGNEVYDCVTSNREGAVDRANGGYGWSPAVFSWRFDNPRKRSERWVVENNYFHDNWGECFDALYLRDSVVRGNQLHDCYSVNLYVDNSAAIRVERNRLYVTTDRFNRIANDQRAHGIALGYESADIGCETTQEGLRCPLHDLVIANNLIAGVTDGILYFHRAGGYSNVTIAHNVVYSPRNESVYFAYASEGGTVRVANNVFYAGPGGPVLVGKQEGWSFESNAYPDGSFPGFGSHPGSLTSNPGVVTPTIAAEPRGFVLQSDSPYAGAGAPVDGVNHDFWCTERSTSRPSIGIHEAAP